MDVLKEISEVDAACASLSAMKRNRDELNAAIEVLQKQIIHYMENNQLSLFQTQHSRALYRHYQTKRFDVKAFATAHPNMYKKYMRNVDTERFRVSYIGDTGE